MNLRAHHLCCQLQQVAKNHLAALRLNRGSQKAFGLSLGEGSKTPPIEQNTTEIHYGGEAANKLAHRC